MSEQWFETAFGAHYPHLYAHRDRAEAARCFDLLPKLAPLSPNGCPVLDLGCGDGRHLEFLENAGYDCLGVDLSAPLLELARQRQGRSWLLRGDMRTLGFQDHSLDSVLSLFTAFGYFGPLKKNAMVVKEIARVLGNGGHWFLDYFNCDDVVQELGSEQEFVREREDGPLKIRETRWYSAEQAQVCKEVDLQPSDLGSAEGSGTLLPPGGLRYTEKVAVFSLKQMDELALNHGLVRVAAAGNYDGSDLGQGPRWILVYRKTKMMS